MPECREKVSPASAFLPVVSWFSPASAFRHQGSVRYRWSRTSLALPSYGNIIYGEHHKKCALYVHIDSNQTASYYCLAYSGQLLHRRFSLHVLLSLVRTRGKGQRAHVASPCKQGGGPEPSPLALFLYRYSLFICMMRLLSNLPAA